jgi:uncharacterized protein
MAGAQSVIALDSNVLIYAHRAGCAEHRRAQAALEKAAASPGGWGFSLPSLGEFWAQVTHPKYPGAPASVDEASGFLRQLTEAAGAQVFLPGPGFPSRLASSARQLRATGFHVFDVQIAMMALENGATVFWTHDRSILRLPGLKYFDPIAP